MDNFGSLLRNFRERTSDPDRLGRRLTQERLGELLGAELGSGGFSGAAISAWERGMSRIHKDDRLVLVGLLKILHRGGGLSTPAEANDFLEVGNYRSLNAAERAQIFAEAPTNTSQEDSKNQFSNKAPNLWSWVSNLFPSAFNQQKANPVTVTPMQQLLQDNIVYEFDVAISFAGTERVQAEQLATILRENGYRVFYDNFYPEQLWGKDLVVFFDEIFRKKSKFCVILVSKDYLLRMWTNHERRSAQSRALEERGREYILPVKVDNSDLPGMQPSVGYLSITEHDIEHVASILIKKLGSTG